MCSQIAKYCYCIGNFTLVFWVEYKSLWNSQNCSNNEENIDNMWKIKKISAYPFVFRMWVESEYSNWKDDPSLIIGAELLYESLCPYVCILKTYL